MQTSKRWAPKKGTGAIPTAESLPKKKDRGVSKHAPSDVAFAAQFVPDESSCTSDAEFDEIRGVCDDRAGSDEKEGPGDAVFPKVVLRCSPLTRRWAIGRTAHA